MPFESKAQQKWMYANKPDMAEKWQRHTPNSELLPDRIHDKKKKKYPKAEEMQNV